MKKWIIIGSIALVALGGVLMYALGRLGPEVSVHRETSEQRQAALRAAFVPGSPAVDAAISDPGERALIERQLKRLGHAILKSNEREIYQLFSADAFTSYMIEAGIVDLGHEPLERYFTRKMLAIGFRSGMFTSAHGFSDIEVKEIVRLSETEAVAYIIAYVDSIDSYKRMRWWLLKPKKDADWLAYDFEYIDETYRYSQFMGELVAGEMDSEPWTGAYDRYLDVAYNGDDEATLAVCERVLGYDLPEVLEIEARLMQVTALYSEDRTRELFASLDRVVDLTGGAPSVRLERGMYLHYEGEHRRAVDDFESFAATFGWDEYSREPAADCYCAIGRFDKALSLAAEGLADNPQSHPMLATLAVALPAERHAEILEHMALLDDQEAGFEEILIASWNHDRDEVRDFIAPHLRAAFPESELIDLYLTEDPDPQPATESAE